jgi:hypothetical protein
MRFFVTNWIDFGNLSRGYVPRKARIQACGHALWSLLEAAAMLIVTRDTAGRKFERNRALGLTKPRTARMPRRLNMVMSRHVLGHSTRRRHVAGVH